MSRKLSATDPERSTYGARLRAARAKLGLTQQQVADRLGCNRQYVCDLEAGRRLEAWPAWLAMVQLLAYDPAIVAPELVQPDLVNERTACLADQVSEQPVKRAAEKKFPLEQ